MTELERFWATAGRQRPDQLLFYASFTPDLHRRVVEVVGTKDLAGHFGAFAPQGVDLKPPPGYVPPDYSRYYEDRDLPKEATINGFGVASVPAGYFHFTGFVHPLQRAESLQEIEEYPLPDLFSFESEHMASQVQEAHRQGKAAVCWIGHMYETAWQIRGYEEFLVDLLVRPEWAATLLERLCELNTHKARMAARAGVDLLRCGDDVANQKTLMFRPDVWREFMKKRWARVFAAAREEKPDIQISYHSDGNIMDIVPELIEIGVTILNPIQPECMDPLEVKRRYGDRLVLDGTIGTQSTMPWGTAEQVRETIRQRIETLGYDGGLIISPTHVLEPEVPVENVIAFYEACQQYGRLR